MSRAELRGRLERAVAEAASAVPGVAYLRPDLPGLIRARTGRIGGRATGAATAGVKAAHRGEHGGWRIEVRVTTLEGHQVLEVTRGIRRSALEAAGSVLGERGRVSVRVTVAGTV